MKNYIFDKIIAPLFKNQLEVIKNSSHILGQSFSLEAQQKAKATELENIIVMSFGSSSTNPVIGVVVDWLDMVPIIKDIITGKKSICFGKTVPYSEVRYRAIMGIEAKLRYHVLCTNSSYTEPKMDNEHPQCVDSVVRAVNIYVAKNPSIKIQQKVKK